jgi:hypothetical protein
MRFASAVQPWLAALVNHTSARHDTGVLASAAETKPAAYPIAPIDQIGALRRSEITRKHVVDIAKKTLRDRRVEKSREKTSGA